MSLVEKESSVVKEESIEEGGSREKLVEEASEEEAPVPKKKGWAGPSRGSMRPFAGSMHEVSNVTKRELIGFRETYQILEDFYLHMLRPED